MRDSKRNKLPRPKSYTSVYDIFRHHPYNILYANPNKVKTQSTSGELNNTERTPTGLITSEKYHFLNKDISYGSIARSTSTIFYDLDRVARRQSFHRYIEVTSSHVRKAPNNSKNTHGFRGQPDVIVQECATQIHPKFLPRDSIEVNTKKIKKKFPNNIDLSSEIFLRDNDYESAYNNNHYYDREITNNTANRHQKFWSYAKFRTEYTNPIPEEKKSKKKDRGKRTEDPCPCQLFSYACPCTDNKKSLTELAKNSKSLTTAEVLSATRLEDKKEIKSKSKKRKNESDKENKVTNTSFEKNSKHEIGVGVLIEEPAVQPSNNYNTTVVEVRQTDKMSIRNKAKSSKRSRLIVCPRCKEKVEIISSTEDDEIPKSNISEFQNRELTTTAYTSPKSNLSEYRNRELTSTTAYTYRSSPVGGSRNKTTDEGDICNHQPRCDLVPVCQLLPENVLPATKCPKKPTRSNPRVIRITKACRHHPPCTVVPSCQRLNVLKNNCEYIPPCLHRPRCVNLPLCVPVSKTFNIDERTFNPVDIMESMECPHIPKCKFIPECQHESVETTANHQFNAISQVQNACEYISKFQYVLNQETVLPPSPPPSSPTPVPSPCVCCKVTKSCQYDCSDCKCDKPAIQASGSDAVIFIRDVGCQFRNKCYSPKESLVHSKTSSASFEYVDVKMGNFYTNVHTLRYEDKFTNPLSAGDLYMSSGSLSSTEIDSQCPSHGYRVINRTRPYGFIPKNTSPYVAAFTTSCNRRIASLSASKATNTRFKEAKSLIYQDCKTPFVVKSRRNFFKGKYKKMFCVKRRKKSRTSSRVINCCSRKIFSEQNVPSVL